MSSEPVNRTVFCEKFKKQLPGLDEPPFDSELGQRIFEHISRDAWGLWIEHCKILLNEYRLNPATKQDQEFLVKQMEEYFFGEGAALPRRNLTSVWRYQIKALVKQAKLQTAIWRVLHAKRFLRPEASCREQI